MNPVEDRRSGPNDAVSIVVLNYNNWADTTDCLTHLFRISYPHFRVIVVDNHSTNDSWDRILSWLTAGGCEYLSLTQKESVHSAYRDSRLVLIRADGNRGYAAGNNIGIRWALRSTDRYVLILNNDTEVHPDFLQPLAALLQERSEAAVVGPKIVDVAGALDRACARRRPGVLDYGFRLGLTLLCQILSGGFR